MHKGKISISRYTSNQPPYRGISISIEDELSGVHFLEVELTSEQLGDAITGQGSVDCNFKLGGLEYIGMKRENKEEWIEIKKGEFIIQDHKRQEELLAPYEVDGWMAHQRDLENHHNFNQKKNAIRVSFVRYVK